MSGKTAAPGREGSPVDLFRLDGRTALVTGASRGIGAAIAVALDAAGARVAITARDRGLLHTVARSLANDPVVIQADLAAAAAASPARVADEALVALGQVDVLVNNAAAAVRAPTIDLDAALFDMPYAVNVRAPSLLIARRIPTLTGLGRGSIVNLSSVSGLLGTPNRAAYAATKGAVDAATRSLACELGPSGIRVNSVAPASSIPTCGRATRPSRGWSRPSRPRRRSADGAAPTTLLTWSCSWPPTPRAS